MDAGATLEFAAAVRLVTGDLHRSRRTARATRRRRSCSRWARRRCEIGIPGEDEFAGRGVSYCVACDGPLFSGQPVVMLGCGQYAAQEADELRQLVSELTVVSLESGRSDARWAESLGSEETCG